MELIIWYTDFKSKFGHAKEWDIFSTLYLCVIDSL